MPSSAMLRSLGLVRTDVSEERISSIMRMTRICKLGTTLTVASNRRTLRRNTANVVPGSPFLITLMMEMISSYETSLFTRATRRNIPEKGVLHSHNRENRKSYKVSFQSLPTDSLFNSCSIFPLDELIIVSTFSKLSH
jgi:hypothetical protein